MIKESYLKNLLNKTSHSNRGMDLENLINESNQYYRDKDICLVYKKPTPIGISKVSYHDNKKIIDKAYFKEKSTLDYNGVYQGYYLDFEAKESLSDTSFPLDNIKEHQTEHIKKVIKHGGITFLIIKICHKYYLLEGTKYLEFINNYDRKSIPYQYIVDNGYELKLGYRPSLNYIEIVDKIIKKDGLNEKEK